jgi:3'-phosphoadenosine 5'-phosphosulfate sulfotransferase (PAPS reductase)/FAD synthetase
MTDHYRIEGPALVSFSGGRTSAYMLHEIVRAHGGKLPENVVVAFANTGREREETLRFVHECGTRWNVRIAWLEWRKGGFKVVGYNSAARHGEPFSELIAKKNYLPNAVARFCTQELKVGVLSAFCRELGWEQWANVVGLRYDEGHRVLKALARNDEGKAPWLTVMPLSKAKITKPAVMEFWTQQPFDLGLRSYEGNCDLCFLKGRGKLLTLMRERPECADWWISQEAGRGRFVTEFSYSELAEQVSRQGFLPFVDDEEEHDAECGLLCGGAA